jgi:hypothetical protein
MVGISTCSEPCALSVTLQRWLGDNASRLFQSVCDPTLDDFEPVRGFNHFGGYRLPNCTICRSLHSETLYLLFAGKAAPAA